jgi:hypothetical protein
MKGYRDGSASGREVLSMECKLGWKRKRTQEGMVEGRKLRQDVIGEEGEDV